ncbi:hypothetical protein PFLUV_G00278420 [Perca fluviatilis]|uniref:Uncharacterized protein n=1 Tax=Perca fluviatilis TaxID=8168 RepID=A0A6A5E096_PERFL|nr:hypothetical protein PFLUV_G00278420 [Perca fluviatilis]
MAADRREDKDGELNVLEDILTEAPDQDIEEALPRDRASLSTKKLAGTKRKARGVLTATRSEGKLSPHRHPQCNKGAALLLL